MYILNRETGSMIHPESIKKRDEQALAVLREVFPDRKIVPFVSTALNIRGGGVHCATKNVPRASK